MTRDDAAAIARAAVEVRPDDTFESWHERLRIKSDGGPKFDSRFHYFRETGIGSVEARLRQEDDICEIYVYRRIDYVGAYCPASSDLVVVYVNNRGEIVPYPGGAF